ncbi:putative internal virion protein/injection protein [Sulfitobacter phage phiGT1]|nr:putative internal virion protein/injection protein [Sulfitobacter phage phiGT1]
MSFFSKEGGGGLFKQGAFQIDPNTTPEMLKAKREALAAMMPQYGRARYIGEGIGQLGTAISSNRQHSAMDKFEGERSQEAAGMFNRIMSGGGSGSSGPLSVLGMRPDAQGGQYQPPNPMDAKYPVGQEGPAPQGNIDPASGLNMGQAAIPQTDEISAYIMQAAQARGIDPQIALAVARSEGLNGDPSEAWQSKVVKNGQRERSYGPYQLYIDGGLGNEFMESTGLDPRDAATWDKQIDFALDHASKNGWGAWYGAKNTGIGNMQGIGVGSPGGGSFAPGQGQQVAQNGGGYQPPQNDGRLNELMMAAQNPWLSPQQRGVINAQIQQVQGQQQAMQQRQWSREDDAYSRAQDQADPLYQLKLRDAQAPKTQFVKGIGLINSGTGEVVNDFGGAAATADGGEYGLTPQYITTPDGSLQMVQISKTGGPAKVVDLPEGAALQKGVQKLDLGTSYQWYNNVTGQPIGEPVPKDLEGAARDSARGAAAGKAEVEKTSGLAEMERNMPGLLTVASQLDALSDDATYTMGGVAYNEVRKQLGLGPSKGALARAEYVAVVDNQVLPLLRQTFGAAFTAKEGDALRATLGDPNKSPAEKKAVLNAFIEQKKRDLEAMGGTVPNSGATANFAGMGVSELNQVDIGGLDAAGMDAWEARMQELGY